VEGWRWLGLLGEGAYMVMHSPTWIEMDLVVAKLGKIKLCDLVVYSGYTINLRYDH